MSAKLTAITCKEGKNLGFKIHKKYLSHLWQNGAQHCNCELGSGVQWALSWIDFHCFFYLVFVVIDHDSPQRDVLRVSSFPLCLQETDNAQVQLDSRRNLQLDHSCLPKTQILSPAPAKYDQESEQDSNIFTKSSLLLRRFVFHMAEASAKGVTGYEPQGTMGRVRLLPAFLCAHVLKRDVWVRGSTKSLSKGRLRIPRKG